MKKFGVVAGGLFAGEKKRRLGEYLGGKVEVKFIIEGVVLRKQSNTSGKDYITL